jgi:Hypoxia induced protein conserved region
MNYSYHRGMHMLLNILVGMVLLAVLGVLAAGMIGIARGTDPRRSNKLMQYRVLLQGAALVLIVILMSLLRG